VYVSVLPFFKRMANIGQVRYPYHSHFTPPLAERLSAPQKSAYAAIEGAIFYMSAGMIKRAISTS